jgi:hypothetical protein
MIDYKDYNKIQEFLNKGDLDSIKKYIEKEKNKYYLKEAREALYEYVKNSYLSFYDYIDGRLIISDGFTGFYVLNNDEVLTQHIKSKCSGYSLEYREKIKEKVLKVYMAYCNVGKLLSDAPLEIGEVSTPKENLKSLIIISKDSKVTHNFQKRLYDESLKILGEDTAVTISSDENNPMFVSKSPKGFCLAMGIKK